jgi:cardiolipin synthase
VAPLSPPTRDTGAVAAPLPAELSYLKELRGLSDRVVSTDLLPGNTIIPLENGEEAYPAMLAAIAAAQDEIVLEMYWFGSDAIGRAFVDALVARAREGTVVRVIYDAVGSAPVDESMFNRLRAEGGDVRAYHPLFARLSRRALARFSKRDHRKILVCDGDVGFTGGLNIGLPWAPPDQGGGGWRDDTVEVRGATARELRILFYQTWRKVIRRRERRDPSRLPPDVGRLFPDRAGQMWVMANDARSSRRAIRATYLRWIRGATKAIDIVNAYFVPDWGLRRALVRAVGNGIQVRILVPEHGDLRVVQWAMEAGLEALVRQGVQAYAYRGAVLHAKTAVVDERYVTVGSYNLDHRSFRYNLEVNLAVHDPTFARQVRRGIEHDIARSASWTLDTLKARGWFRRLMGKIALLFARFL